MTTYIRMALLPILCLGINLRAQPFQCDGAMYVTLLDQSAQSSSLFAIRPGTNIEETVVSPVSQNLGVPLHVIGYNVTDNYIYGFNSNNYHFYRIGTTGQWTDLGIPSNLDTLQFSYYAGDFSPNGSSFLLVARSKSTGFDARFYSIRFQQSGLSAGYVSVISTTPVRLEDIAYDPLFGELLGYDSVAKRIVSVNTAGVISEGSFSTGLPVESLGGLFFDQNGRLFGYGGRQNVHNTLFQFNRINGRLEDTQGAVIGRSSDGCGCPYQVKFTKTIEPPIVLPCSEVTITYHFRNTAGISYGQIQITDTLPDFFTITEIVRPPFFGTVNSGIGESVFDASGMQVLLSEDSVVLRATLSAATPGWYPSQASAGAFPTAMGGILRSDNPDTPVHGDATGIEIAGAADLFPDTVLKRCTGLPFVLKPQLSGDSYRWSTGATESEIEVQNPGTYWLEIQDPCGTYRDTILTESVIPNLIADLGPDRTVIPGETLQLEARHLGSVPQFYAWNSNPEMIFNCNNCALQFIQPFEETTCFITLTDEFGCTASDSILIKMKNDIPVYVANAFSPDDNGINDILYPQGSVSVEIAEFKVFNRWGALVFSGTDGALNVPEYGWDGKISGKPAPTGIYLWMLKIRLADGTEQSFRGSVQLLR